MPGFHCHVRPCFPLPYKWSVDCYDGKGTWVSSSPGPYPNKAAAQKEARKIMRRHRAMEKEKHSTRLTDEPVNSGSCNDGELGEKCDQG